MQVISIKVDGIEEAMLLEFQGDFQSLDFPLGELKLNGDCAVFKCGNVYLQGSVQQLQRPYFIFDRQSDENGKFLRMQSVVRRKILFNKEPNYYEE